MCCLIVLSEPREIWALQKDPCEIRNPKLDVWIYMYSLKKSEDRQLLET